MLSSANKPKSRPNRIYELMKARGWKYADVAERVSKAAQARGDDTYSKVHEVTINRLALGTAKLTQEWMNMLAEVFQVPAHEIIAPPPALNLRRVRVIYALEAGKWRRTDTMPDQEQYDIMVPDDAALLDMQLYAGEVRGAHFDRRYPDKSVLVISRIEQKPGEIVEGKRYHVRATRHSDGAVVNSIRCLSSDGGRYWLKPESSDPEHQAWIPLGGTPEFKIEIVGRVRGVFFRED